MQLHLHQGVRSRACGSEQIIAEGQSVSASGVVEIAGLEPNTAYRLSAVALKGNINGKV